MLKYEETNWKDDGGFEIRKYDLHINTINASRTSLEQMSKIEKISLVAFLNKEQRKPLVNICRRLKQNDSDFYQNSNLHVTVFGFGPLEKKDYIMIQKKIKEFSREKQQNTLSISFEGVRLGTMYTKDKTLRPVQGMSNGTVIAVGNVIDNKEFYNYGNQLTRFLLIDDKIKSTLGANFRRKFPTVWCTLGYYNKNDDVHVGNDLETIFKKYENLNINAFKFRISEISLVKSKYKNLRYPKLIEKYNV